MVVLFAVMTAGCEAPATPISAPPTPTSAQVAAAEQLRHPVAREYWAVTRVIGLDRLRVEPAEGSFAACTGSGRTRERYEIIGQLMTPDVHEQTERFVAAVSAVEHDLAQAGLGELRRSEADPQYLAANKRGITVSFFDVADSFDAVPPPVSEQFIVAGPCTAMAAALAPQLHTVRDYYGPTPGPLPPFKI